MNTLFKKATTFLLSAMLFLSLGGSVVHADRTFSLPDQTGHSGQFLQTNGTNPLWATAGGGGGGTVTSVQGIDSIVATPNPITGAGTLKLVNDSAIVGTSNYYGTDSGGTLGYHALPSLSGFVTNVSASLPLSSSGGTTPNISMTQSGASANGWLSSTDWNTFNNKVSAPALTQFHMYIGNSSNLPVDAGIRLMYDPGVSFLSDVSNNSTFDSQFFINSSGLNAEYVNFGGNSVSALNETSTASSNSFLNNTSNIETGFLATDQVSTTGIINSAGNDTHFNVNDTNVDRFQFWSGGSFLGGINSTGSLVSWLAYPSTRDDTGSFTPVSFIYTDASGNFLEAPLSAIPVVAPTLTDTQIAFGDASNLMTSNANFTYNIADDRFSFASTINSDHGIFYNGSGAPNGLNAHKGLGMDFFAGAALYTLGDTSTSGMDLQIDKVNNKTALISNTVEYLTLDVSGDVFRLGNPSKTSLNLYTQAIEGFINGNNVIDFDQVHHQYSIGDLLGSSTISKIVIDSGVQSINDIIASHNYLTLDAVNHTYGIGDLDGFGDNTKLVADDVADTITSTAQNGFQEINAQYSGDVTRIRMKVTLTPAEIKTGSSIPIDVGLPLPGIGFYYRVVSFDAFLTFNSVPYTSNALYIGNQGANAGAQLVTANGITLLGATADANTNSAPAGAGVNQIYLENTGVFISADLDSAVGDSNVDCYITVEKVAL